MKYRTAILLIITAAVALSLTDRARAASACYMKIADIKGESQDADHKDWIEIESFSPQLELPAGAPPRMQSSPGQINIVKHTDKASPKLQQYAANGKHIPTTVLQCRKAGDQPLEYFQIRMTDVLVSSFEPTRNMEQVTFNYKKIQWQWLPQKRTRR